MHVIRSINSAPVAVMSAYEAWWKQRQAVLQTCPGFVDRQGDVGLWNSLAYPTHFLVIDVWESRTAANAAARGAFGEFVRRTPRPAEVSVVIPGEAWEGLNRVTREGTPVGAVSSDAYLRQVEWTVRPSAVAAFERSRAEFFPLLQQHAPEVRASVIYRSAGIAGRYRVVHRSTATGGEVPAELRAWMLTHPASDYADTPPVNELFMRAL